MSALQDKLSEQANLVVLRLDAKEAAKLVQRNTVVPAGWLALAERSSREMSVIPAGAELATAVGEPLSFFRAGPVPVSFLVRPIRTADGIEMSYAMTLRVCVRPTVSDLRRFLSEFAERSKSTVAISDLESYLREPVLVATRVFGRGRTAVELSSTDAAAACVDYLSEALSRSMEPVGLAGVPGWLAKPQQLEAAVVGSTADAGASGQNVLHEALLTEMSDLARTASSCLSSCSAWWSPRRWQHGCCQGGLDMQHHFEAPSSP